MPREMIQIYSEVIDTVRAFNNGLEEDENLRNQLGYFRAWYYIPEIDMVGPSKFVGYKGMTAAEYLRSYEELDGRDTEPVLSRLFEEMDPNEGDRRREANYVRRLVESLLERYGKVPNKKSRFNAPEQWNLGEDDDVTPHGDVRASARGSTSRPMVELFWRAFLTLYTDDQRALAQRIADYVQTR
ncbi:MAG: hypothetical protein JW753_05270 [Dehalococcoidia bacterium]|nr:hypothetical protein [Dehalococcoidia bacterium]